MQGRIITNTTPQQKIVAVNNRFGNTNIAQQQGTTRVIYDSLPLDGSTELRFFENAQSRQYPFTNIGAEGNRLNVGETFVIQKIYFGIISVTENEFTNFGPLANSLPASFAQGDISFLIANSQVLKNLPFDSLFNPLNNFDQRNASDEAFNTFTDIVIPPLLEYVLTYRLNTYDADNTLRLTCFIQGTAAILAPQTTF